MAQADSIPEIEIMMRHPPLLFTLPPDVPMLGPRVGRLVLTRDGGPPVSGAAVVLDTPNILVGTSRGVVPHLSQDHTNGSDAIRWINVPFESFLEQDPPVPTLQNSPHPLHTFLGFDMDRHIVSFCLRNPVDTREMPPNGATYVSANCVRGVKKVAPSDWRKYAYKMQPDVVFALTDTPLTPPPYSQKRITKSIERSLAWVADLLRRADVPPLSRHPGPLNVFVHMAGGMSIPARESFAYGLKETLHGPEADAVRPLRSLDEGISGYVFDLATLRGITPAPNMSQHQSLPDSFLRLERPDMLQHPEATADAPTPSTTGEVGLTAPRLLVAAELSVSPDIDLPPLFKASLEGLSERKPRLVTGVRSPHEILRLVRDVGIDLFDVGWAMVAANIGIALDFVFPAPAGGDETDGNGRRCPLGHNLYDPVYARQYGRLSDTLMGAGENEHSGAVGLQVCLCIACSPRVPNSRILHSTVDHQSYAPTGEEAVIIYGKPHSRAYIHHLLHTHEMSAHTLLMAHNLAVASTFLAGVRMLCEDSPTQFAFEVGRFISAYDESGKLLLAAKRDWEYVDKARGKGRLAREREKQDGQLKYKE